MNWEQAVAILAEYVEYTETDGNDEPTQEQQEDYEGAVAQVAGILGYFPDENVYELLADYNWAVDVTQEDVKHYLRQWL